METISLAMVQMRSEKGAIAENLTIIKTRIEEANSRQATFICFPEMSITGSVTTANYPAAFLAVAGPEVRSFVAMTEGTSITAIAGFAEANPEGKPFITQIVAREGKLQGFYRKITIAPDEEAWYSPGDTVRVFAHPLVVFSLAICYDITNGGVFRESAAQGARLIFEAAAPGLYGAQETRNWQTGYDWWRDECISKLGEQARLNNVYIAVATQAGRTIDEDFPGGGYLFTPRGECISETAGPWEEVLYATLVIE